jgi:hypothetical protein
MRIMRIIRHVIAIGYLGIAGMLSPLAIRQAWSPAAHLDPQTTVGYAVFALLFMAIATFACLSARSESE